MTLPAAAATTDVPATIRAILGPPALLSSEDAAIYEATLAHFAREVGPRDLIAWMLIKDLADHRLEIARYRRLRAAVVRHSVDHSTQAMLAQLRSAYQNQMSLLDEVTDRTRAEIEARGGANVAQDCAELDAYAASERDATDWLRDLVIAGTDNPTDDDVAANLPSWIGGYQQLDRCLQAAEQRFIATLRDIERHVAGFGKTLRRLDVIVGEVLDEEAT